MIISERNRYIFVQLPHTASTAVAEELKAHYDGRDILDKHSPLTELRHRTSYDPANFFVFSTIRNPLDEVVSMFYKLKRNHKGVYSDPANYVENGGWITRRTRRRFEYVQKEDVGFAEFLKRFYRFPYTNWSLLEHKEFDYVMRFERLQEDFRTVLDLLGKEEVRPLPVVNPTSRPKRSLSEHYPRSVRQHTARVFHPFMEYWGYEMPQDWKIERPGVITHLVFRVISTLKSIYWRNQTRWRKFF